MEIKSRFALIRGVLLDLEISDFGWKKGGDIWFSYIYILLRRKFIHAAASAYLFDIILYLSACLYLSAITKYRYLS